MLFRVKEASYLLAVLDDLGAIGETSFHPWINPLCLYSHSFLFLYFLYVYLNLHLLERYRHV